MRRFKIGWTLWTWPLLALGAMALWFCEPGTSLNPVDPGSGSGKVPVIRITADRTTLVAGADTVFVSVSVRDSANNALGGDALSLTAQGIVLLQVAAAAPFVPPTTVPSGGSLTFRIASNQVGSARLVVEAGSGAAARTDTLRLVVAERPVAPRIELEFPAVISPTDSPVVKVTVLDSSRSTPTPLANAVVQVTSTFFSIFRVENSRSLSADTTSANGQVVFRVHSAQTGTGSISIRVRTAAGMERTATATITVTSVPNTDRPRSMSFVASRPVLKADGSDSTQLVVVVKDDNNNPLQGEKIRFTATGGLVQAEATTDSWGKAVGMLVSERVNKTVVVTATLVKTGATAQQNVSFDGITIRILPARKVSMRDSVIPVTFELHDANANPMSGDTLEILADGIYRGFGRRFSSGGITRDSMLVTVDTRGQYRTTVMRDQEGNLVLRARALGASAIDTVRFTNNSLRLTASPAAIPGNGSATSLIRAELVSGTGSALTNHEMRWTTTFGTFTRTPFSRTSSAGRDSIQLRAPNGSGLATVNVEAYHPSNGTIQASSSITVRVTALPVKRLTMKVTPDNIPVRVGEAKLIAQAYDSSDNVMTNVLIGFRLIKGAGGGDEVIDPPVDFTQQGFAQSTLKAGGVISFYQGVKLSAVALDIVGNDTLVIAASDTVNLTVSGPPHKVSVGTNILRGLNPNDGTFQLPTAAVVTDVNGNHVADGTPVAFGVHPVMGYYRYERIAPSTFSSAWFWRRDTVDLRLPWTDYNNNGKLDLPDESPSGFNSANPARGEDRDGNGIIHIGPDSYSDINNDGIWNDGVTSLAEPRWIWSYQDTAACQSTGGTCRVDIFFDHNGNGIRDLIEPFTRNGVSYFTHVAGYDSAGNPRYTSQSTYIPGVTAPCRCTGQRDPVTGALYEETYFGSPRNRPYPGYAAIGIDRQVTTVAGKATTLIQYVQSDATHIMARITAESNGIRNTVDDRLPIILGGD